MSEGCQKGSVTALSFFAVKLTQYMLLCLVAQPIPCLAPLLLFL